MLIANTLSIFIVFDELLWFFILFTGLNLKEILGVKISFESCSLTSGILELISNILYLQLLGLIYKLDHFYQQIKVFEINIEFIFQPFVWVIVQGTILKIISDRWC